MQKEPPVFIGQFQLASQETAEVSLRKTNGVRTLVFSTINPIRGEPTGFAVELAQIPHLQTILMNAHARALIDGPITNLVAL